MKRTMILGIIAVCFLTGCGRSKSSANGIIVETITDKNVIDNNDNSDILQNLYDSLIETYSAIESNGYVDMTEYKPIFDSIAKFDDESSKEYESIVRCRSNPYYDKLRQEYIDNIHDVDFSNTTFFKVAAIVEKYYVAKTIMGLAEIDDKYNSSVSTGLESIENLEIERFTTGLVDLAITAGYPFIADPSASFSWNGKTEGISDIGNIENDVFAYIKDGEMNYSFYINYLDNAYTPTIAKFSNSDESFTVNSTNMDSWDGHMWLITTYSENLPGVQPVDNFDNMLRVFGKKGDVEVTFESSDKSVSYYFSEEEKNRHLELMWLYDCAIFHKKVAK